LFINHASHTQPSAINISTVRSRKRNHRRFRGPVSKPFTTTSDTEFEFESMVGNLDRDIANGISASTATKPLERVETT
jgi:hypothetical protein